MSVIILWSIIQPYILKSVVRLIDYSFIFMNGYIFIILIMCLNANGSLYIHTCISDSRTLYHCPWKWKSYINASYWYWKWSSKLLHLKIFKFINNELHPRYSISLYSLRDQRAKIIDSSSQAMKILLPEQQFLLVEFWNSHNSYPERKSVLCILRNSAYLYLD